MRLNDLVKSRVFKNFMAKLYGWGAAVVILGALFKILHLPGANYMLMAGMGTETIIFFFSAFEPPHVEPDWSLVYPELAGMYHGDTFSAEIEDPNESDPFIEEGPTEEEKKFTEVLKEMLENAGIDQKLIDELGQGMSKLSQSASELNEMSSASAANDQFVANLSAASQSADTLSQNFQKTASSVDAEINATQQHVQNLGMASESAIKLANSYSQASEALNRDMNATEAFNTSVNEATRSANKLAENYAQSAEHLKAAAQSLDFSDVDAAAYTQQLQNISQNLEALNAAYELQLQNNQTQMESSQQLQEMMKEYFNQMHASVEQTKQYREQAELLTKNVSALNNVYGNMLTAMNVKTS